MRSSEACLLAVLLALMQLSSSWAGASDERVAELIKLRAKAKDAVITLDETSFKRFIAGTSRPFTAVIFFTANSMISDNPSLRLVELRKEYGFSAQAFANGPDATQMFFFAAVLEDSSVPFATFQVNSLPFIVRLGPEKAITKPPVELAKSEKMLPDSIPDKYPWSAESFVKFLGQELRADAINRPSFVKSPVFPFIVLAALALIGYAAHKAYQTDFVRQPWVWMAGSIVIFWWSVSGGMYNIIRGMPMYTRGKDGKLQFFLAGRGGSLGAEGMIIATTYIGFSIALAIITFALPRVQNTKLRSPMCLGFTLIAGYSIYKSLTLWMDKTGHGVVSYLWR